MRSRAELPVTCYDSSGSPCPCFADGIALAIMLRSDAHGLFWVRADRIEPAVLPGRSLKTIGRADDDSLQSDRSIELAMHLNRWRCTTRVRVERRTAGSGNGFIVRHCSSSRGASKTLPVIENQMGASDVRH